MKQVRSLLMGVTLAIGIALGWWFLVIASLEKQIPEPTWMRKSLMFSQSLNSPVILHEVYEGPSRRQNFDLEGNDVSDKVEKNVGRFVELSLALPRFSVWQRIMSLGPCGDDECWYLIDAKNGRCYLEVYSLSSGERIGTLGRDGLRHEVPPFEAQFPLANGQVDARSVLFGSHFAPNALIRKPYGHDVVTPPVYINTGNLVYRVDFCKRVVDISHRSEIPIRTIGGTIAHMLTSDGSRTEISLPLFVLTEKQLTLFDGHESSQAFELPPALQHRDLYMHHSVSGLTYLYAKTDQIANLVAFGANGEGLWEREVVLENSPRPWPAFYPYFASIPVPVAWAVHLLCIHFAPYVYYPAPFYKESFSDYDRPDFRIAFTVVVAISAILALLTYRRQRRYYQSPIVSSIWATLVFLGGPPAYLAFLAHRYWPPRETLLPPKVEPEAIELTGREILA